LWLVPITAGALLVALWLLPAGTAESPPSPGLTVRPSPASNGTPSATAPDTQAATPAVPPLQLLATSVSDLWERSRATIHDTELAQRSVLALGDSLPGRSDSTVVEIEEQRIVLQWGGKRMVLDLESNAPTPPSQAAIEIKEVLAKAETMHSEEELLAAFAQVMLGQQGARNGASLGFQGAFTLYRDSTDGERVVGIKLEHRHDGSFYHQLGLEAGDVIVQINGQPMNSGQALGQALQLFEEATELALQVHSDGEAFKIRSHTVSVHP